MPTVIRFKSNIIFRKLLTRLNENHEFGMRLQQEIEQDPKPHPTDTGIFQIHLTLNIKSDTAARLRKMRDTGPLY